MPLLNLSNFTTNKIYQRQEILFRKASDEKPMDFIKRNSCGDINVGFVIKLFECFKVSEVELKKC